MSSAGQSPTQLGSFAALLETHGGVDQVFASEENVVTPVTTTPKSITPGVDHAEGQNPHQEVCTMSPLISTTIAHQGYLLVNIHGLWVLKDHASVNEQIYAKYGDISPDCKCNMPGIKTVLMESVIHIIRLFQHHTGQSLGAQDHAFIRNNLGELKLSILDVGWLKERYNLAIALVEQAKDITTHGDLSKQIAEMEALMKKLKDDRDLVSAQMNERRRTSVPRGGELDLVRLQEWIYYDCHEVSRFFLVH